QASVFFAHGGVRLALPDAGRSRSRGLRLPVESSSLSGTRNSGRHDHHTNVRPAALPVLFQHWTCFLMPRLALKFVLLGLLFAAAGGGTTAAQTTSASAPASSPNATVTSAGAGSSAQTIDGIAARIEDDIITESEVKELGAFQALVDGKPKLRDE